MMRNYCQSSIGRHAQKSRPELPPVSARRLFALGQTRSHGLFLKNQPALAGVIARSGLREGVRDAALTPRLPLSGVGVASPTPHRPMKPVIARSRLGEGCRVCYPTAWATKQSGGITAGVDSWDCFAALAMAPDCFAALAMAPDYFAALAMAPDYFAALAMAPDYFAALAMAPDYFAALAMAPDYFAALAVAPDCFASLKAARNDRLRLSFICRSTD